MKKKIPFEEAFNNLLKQYEVSEGVLDDSVYEFFQTHKMFGAGESDDPFTSEIRSKIYSKSKVVIDDFFKDNLPKEDKQTLMGIVEKYFSNLIKKSYN